METRSCRIIGSTREPYSVTLRSCDCYDFSHRRLPCKHMYYLNDRLTADGVENPPAVFPDKYIVVDTETSGLDSSNDVLLEIGALKIENNVVVDTFHSYIHRLAVPEAAARVNGITPAMLADAPDETDVIKAYYAFSGELPVVGHNISFDVGFLRAAIQRDLDKPYSVTFYDTLQIARASLDISSKKLGSVADHLGIIHTEDHSALGDAKTTFAVFLSLGGKLADVRRFAKTDNDEYIPRKEFSVPAYPAAEEEKAKKKRLPIDIIGLAVSAVLFLISYACSEDDNEFFNILLGLSAMGLFTFIVIFVIRKFISGKKK